MADGMLRPILHHNVPQYIAHILSKGGVTEEEWRWLQREDESPDCLAGILMRADEYLLYPKNEKILNQGLFALTLGLAIMSFVPCGVRFCGLHFWSELENFVVVENVEEAGLYWAKIREVVSTREGRQTTSEEIVCPVVETQM